MDCDRADLVIGLLEGELDPAEQAEVEAHLQACGACRATRDAYAATLADLKALPAERPSAEAAARAYAAVIEAMGGGAGAARTATGVAPAGKVVAFPAPRAQGRRALVIQLAAAAACLLLVVALVAPEREARHAARAPAAAPAPAADAAPAQTEAAPPAAKAAPAGSRAIAQEKEEKRDAAADRSFEGDDAQALRLEPSDARRRREEAAREAEAARDEDVAGVAPAAPQAAPAKPAESAPRRTAPSTRPPSTPPSTPPPSTEAPASAASGPRGAAAGRPPGGGSTEALGEPDGAGSARGGLGEDGRSRRGVATPPSSRPSGAPPPSPPSPPSATEATEATEVTEAPPAAPEAGRAAASAALAAWRVTLDGETVDVALVAGAAEAAPRLVVALPVPREEAPADAPEGAAGPAADRVELLAGAASSPDLARVLAASGAELDLGRPGDPEAAKRRQDAGPAPGARERRLLLALLAHEVAGDAPRPEAVVVARAERVAALLAALDGRPIDGALLGDRAGRKALLQSARERVERDVAAPGRSAR